MLVLAARCFRGGLRGHLLCAWHRAPQGHALQGPEIPAPAVSRSSREMEETSGQWEPQAVPAPRAQGSGKPFRPLCPGTGTAERRMRRPPLQFASVTHPDIYWQFTLRQKLKGEAGQGTPTGATRGGLADGWGRGFGRFDPSFLTELGPEERAPPSPPVPELDQVCDSGFSLVA